MEADVFPALGRKFIDDVTAADVRELMLVIERRGARDVSKRSHETTGQMFRYAIVRGIATRNPAADFKPSDILSDASSENFARVDAKELPALLVKVENYDGDALIVSRIWTMGSGCVLRLHGCSNIARRTGTFQMAKRIPANCHRVAGGKKLR